MIAGYGIKASMAKTKQEAAELLGVKPRTLELYTQQGRLSVKYVKGQRGRMAQYDEAELETLKLALEKEADSAYPQRGALIAKPHAGIARRDPEQLLQLLSAALISRPEASPPVPIAEKLMLSIVEAAALTGLSRAELREAIRDRKLQAIRRRGFKIKRSDLDSFIKKL